MAVVVFAVSSVCPCAKIAPAAEQADVKGWNHVRWGMTIAQAKAALGPNVRIVSEPKPQPGVLLVDRLRLPSVKLENLELEAAIQTLPGSDRICAVTLRLKNENHKRENRQRAFDSLKEMLVSKYGAPTMNESKPNEKASTWRFATGLINLKRFELTMIGFGNVSVQYKEHDRNLQDKL